MIYLMDYLGGARFKKLILDEHPMAYGAGFFSYVDGFGDSLPVVSALAAKGCLLFRIHLCWKDNHKFTDKDLPFIKKEARRLKPIIAKYPNVKWYVSPCCEHELSESSWANFAREVARELGGVSYDLVNSPNHNKGFVSRTVLNEYHGAESKPRGGRYAFSFDGTNIVDSDVESFKKNYSQAEYFGIWNCQMNGRKTQGDKTPRSMRNAYPTSKQLDSWIFLTKEKGRTKLPSKWIWKSHSDQHKDKPEGKDQKPVVIITDIKQKYSRIELKASNGQVIARSSPPSSFDDKATGKQIGWRWYFAEWGYEIAQKSFRIQKQFSCDVFVNNKKVGVVNPAFRDGSYR